MNHPMIVKRSDVMPEMDQKKDEKKQDLCNGKLQGGINSACTVYGTES